ncbi:hypothetical protein [Paenibacillus sp. sgz5001063]|uniref:hypothetical protein n=1 Tax=Paenibacillus sp. sgz5001063 TaxID=3242474 RepID=UPI0036D28174
MPIVKKAQTPATVTIAEGIYNGMVKSTSLLNNVQTMNGPRDKLKISFDIDCNGIQQTVSERYDAEYSEGSKLHSVFDVFLEEVPEEFDTDILVGLECRVEIERRQLSDGKPWNGVKAVLPPSYDTEVVSPSHNASTVTLPPVIPPTTKTMKRMKPSPAAAIAAVLAKRSGIKNSPSSDAGYLFEDEESEGSEE